MYSILAVDPSFGGAYNVKKTLTRLGPTTLVCTHPDKWRRRPADTIDFFLGSKYSEFDGSIEAAEAIRQSKFVFLIGGSAMAVAERLPGFQDWLPTMNTAVWYTDSFYRQHPEHVNNWMIGMDIKRYFVLPDGCYMEYVPQGAIPLHHCVSIRGTASKSDHLTVVHSPGTNPKRKQKQSEAIEAVVRGLQGLYNFSYKCLMGLPHAEARREIRSAHIHIDKLAGYSTGLGKSGLEGMAGGAVELSAYYYLKEYERYFPEPPAIQLTSAASLGRGLERVLKMDLASILSLGATCRRWVEDYWGLESGTWLRYLRRFVTL